MKFRYIGEYPEGKTSLTCFGAVFAPDLEVELSGEAARKASGNRFFIAVENDADVVIPADDSTFISGMTKAELITAADQYGIKIDRRWSAEKIATAITATQAKEE